MCSTLNFCVNIILKVKSINYKVNRIWGVSAAGSASHWQCGGHEFESRTLHTLQQEPKRLFFSGFSSFNLRFRRLIFEK